MSDKGREAHGIRHFMCQLDILTHNYLAIPSNVILDVLVKVYWRWDQHLNQLTWKTKRKEMTVATTKHQRICGETDCHLC